MAAKTFKAEWNQNGDVFECQDKSGTIHYRRLSDGREYSLPLHEFWRHFRLVGAEPAQRVEHHPAGQRGLF